MLRTIFLMLAAFFFITQTSAQCTLDSSIDKLWSGSVTFSIPQSPNNTLAFSFQTFNIPTPRRVDRNSEIQYAFALSSIHASTTRIFYFDLLVLKTFQSSLMLNFIYQPNRWTSITYNYWISYRQDIHMGVASFSQNQIVSGDSYQIAIKADFDHSERSQYVVMAFLNGLRYDSGDNHSIGIVITEQYVGQFNLVVKFQDTSVLPLKLMTLSYVLYIPQQIPLISYGGVINHVDFSSEKSKNLHYLLPNSNFLSLIGLSSILPSENYQNSLTFQAKISEKYTLTYSLKDWEKVKAIQLSYIIIGQRPSRLCLAQSSCQSTGQLYIHNKECVNRCPETTEPVVYMDGATECRDCPPNMQYSASIKKCECMNGFVKNQLGQCIKKAPVVLNSVRGAGDLLQYNNYKKCLNFKAVQENDKNLFLTLEPSNNILTNSRISDQDYLQITFPDPMTASNSYYCTFDHENQQFNCLLLFSRGVPKGIFDIVFTLWIDGRSNCSSKITYKSIRK